MNITVVATLPNLPVNVLVTALIIVTRDAKIFACALSVSLADANHRLNLFYLANDVIQNCKRKNAIAYRGAFAEVLPNAALLVRYERKTWHFFFYS